MTVMNTTQADIDRLDELQAKENDGRGISCVRTILTYLRRGENQLAAAVRSTEGDKTRVYPEVEEQLYQMFGCRTHRSHDCGSEICAFIRETHLKDLERHRGE